jgi:hypothetical protein
LEKIRIDALVPSCFPDERLFYCRVTHLWLVDSGELEG